MLENERQKHDYRKKLIVFGGTAFDPTYRTVVAVQSGPGSGEHGKSHFCTANHAATSDNSLSKFSSSILSIISNHDGEGQPGEAETVKPPMAEVPRVKTELEQDIVKQVPSVTPGVEPSTPGPSPAMNMNSVFSAKLKLLNWKKQLNTRKAVRRNERNSAEETVDRDGIFASFEGLSSDQIEHLDLRLQANLDHYTDAALRQRELIAKDPAFNKCVAGWWEDFILPTYDDDGDRLIQRSEYRNMYRSLRRVMRKLFQLSHTRRQTKHMATEEEQRDWESDVGGAGEMGLTLFKKSIFELIDHWCDDIRVEKYIDLTNSLFSQMEESALRKRKRPLRKQSVCSMDSVTKFENAPVFHPRVGEKVYKSMDWDKVSLQLRMKETWRRGIETLITGNKKNKSLVLKAEEDEAQNCSWRLHAEHKRRMRHQKWGKGGMNETPGPMNRTLSNNRKHVVKMVWASSAHMDRQQISKYCLKQHSTYGSLKTTIKVKTKKNSLEVYGDCLDTHKKLKYAETVGGIYTSNYAIER